MCTYECDTRKRLATPTEKKLQKFKKSIDFLKIKCYNYYRKVKKRL